jgi:DHA1 family multidrug resistance protein-like MFS transporter
MNTAQRDNAVMAYLERHPTAVKRIDEHRLQHSQTVGTTRSRPWKELPPFGGGKEYPPLLPEREEYVVEFNGHDDPTHPQNWATKRKMIIFSILVFNSLSATFASAVFSPAGTTIGSIYDVNQPTVTLGTSLFVLGYAFGPLFWAPFSELKGRRLPVIIASSGFGIFMIAVAVSKDIQTLLICRFFAGLFGSCALTIVPAIFSDIFNNETRGMAIAAFAASVFNGPLAGPMIGGFITKSYLGWRWTQYIPSFMAFACAILALFFLDESYPPIILVAKASELRRLTRNWGIHAKQEEVEVDLKELVTKNVSRPLRILFQEPIVLLVSIYMSFMYGMLYLSLTGYSIVFGKIHGMSPGVSGLPYIGMIIGVMIGFAAVTVTNPGYIKKLQANNNIPVPEWRLFWPMVGGVSFTIGLFWFGWTGYTASIPWIVPTLAGIFLGFGIYTVFLQLMNYIIDSYLMFAASAIAGNTLLRSLCGFAFPMFATQMFNGIGMYMREQLHLTLHLLTHSRRQLGHDHLRLLLRPSNAHALHLLLLRQTHQGEEQVRTSTRPPTGQQAQR